MIAPLRKRRLKTGETYARHPDVEATLRDLDSVPRDELVRRCAIADARDPLYVPTECLLHFVRRTRDDNSEAWFERLYKELIRRVLRRLPAIRPDGAETQMAEEIRDYVLDRFQDLLAADRAGYCERLDIYEVDFDAALSSLRTDGQRKAWRRERRRTPLEDRETGEVTAEAEAAAGVVDPFADAGIDDPAYRKRLEAAIETLPPEQKEIVHMLKLGFPIESKDPNVMSIAKALGCVEKTVRKRRDRAYATLRAIMSAGDAP